MKSTHETFEKLTLVDQLEVRPASIVEYYTRNKVHLAPSMPLRGGEVYTEAFWQKQMLNYKLSLDADRELRFMMLDGDAVIGSIHYDQIIKGPFQACYLGYSIDREYQGKGLMREALLQTISQTLSTFGLNRIMANYEPSNQRSGRLLKSLGFEREGYARKYLKLNGTWKDHILTSYISD